MHTTRVEISTPFRGMRQRTQLYEMRASTCSARGNANIADDGGDYEIRRRNN